MLAIKPSGLDSADEELRSVGVGTSVGHGQDTRSSMGKGEVLIGKLFTIDRLASSTVLVGKVSSSVEKQRPRQYHYHESSTFIELTGS